MFKRWALALSVAVLSVGALAAPHKATPPTIIATQNFLNQTADLPPTTVFTPTVTGMYRISLYFECQQNTSCGFGSKFVQLNYTDASGSTSLGGEFGSDLVIHPASGTPVQVLTSGSIPTYNLYVVVEQLF